MDYAHNLTGHVRVIERSVEDDGPKSDHGANLLRLSAWVKQHVLADLKHAIVCYLDVSGTGADKIVEELVSLLCVQWGNLRQLTAW